MRTRDSNAPLRTSRFSCSEASCCQVPRQPRLEVPLTTTYMLAQSQPTAIRSTIMLQLPHPPGGFSRLEEPPKISLNVGPQDGSSLWTTKTKNLVFLPLQMENIPTLAPVFPTCSLKMLLEHQQELRSTTTFLFDRHNSFFTGTFSPTRGGFFSDLHITIRRQSHQNGEQKSPVHEQTTNLRQSLLIARENSQTSMAKDRS